MRNTADIRHASRWVAVGAFAVALGCLSPFASAQDRDRRDSRADTITTLNSGTEIGVRTNEPIEVQRRDTRVFSGIVDRDVRGDDGRVAIPRGAAVELVVRAEADNDLVLDLDSVTVNGQRYAVRTEPNRTEANNGGLVGSIVGAITGARGREIRIPRDSIVTFRLQRPLDVNVPDRGVDRDGHHWHDWER